MKGRKGEKIWKAGRIVYANVYNFYLDYLIA